MTSSRPNILFLSIDALRADRMSLYGYRRPTTPRLDEIGNDAIVCRRNSSLAGFTQASFPTIFCSSRPLSYGGYDWGARGRPETLFNVMAKGGYDVISLTTFKWVSRYYGYGGGVRKESHLYSPKALMGAAVNRCQSSILAFQAGEIGTSRMLELVAPVLEDLFEQLIDFSQERIRSHCEDLEDFGKTSLVQDGFDFNAVRRITERHRDQFRDDPVGYVSFHFQTIPEAHEWIAADWRFARTKSKLFREAIFRGTNKLLGSFAPERAVLRANRFKQFIDGNAIANRVIRTLREHDRKRPFLIWTHFFDTHVPYLPGRCPYWYDEAPDYLEAVGYPRNLDLSVMPFKRPQDEAHREIWSAVYDATIRYVDMQIGRILDALDACGLRKDTLVVVCSDHGEELGEHGNYSHYFRLHQHSTSVPMLFHRPGIGRNHIDDLTTLMDLAPTVADLVGVKPAENWQGLAVTDPRISERNHVVMESFHGGNCLFDSRPIYMATRGRQYELIWREWNDPNDIFGVDGHELYDLDADPLEQNNLYREDHPALSDLLTPIERRLSEIGEFPADRLAAVRAELQCALNAREFDYTRENL